MSTPIKTYGVRLPDEPKPPFPFRIEFTKKPPSEDPPIVKEFSAVGEAPIGADVALASMQRIGRHGKTIIDLPGLYEYFRIVLSESDYFALRELLDDPLTIVPIETLLDIIRDIIAHQAGRPTSPSPASSGGRRIIEASATEQPPTQE